MGWSVGSAAGTMAFHPEQRRGDAMIDRDTAAQVRARDLEVDGVTTTVLSSGPDDDAAEAAVFVHGNPGSGEDWRGLLARAGTVGRALAWDHPGYGRSTVPPSFEYTVEGYGRHMQRMLDRLGVRRSHLVLHDLGGLWMLPWAARNPERFASATLLNVGVLPGYRWHMFARVWRTPVIGELSLTGPRSAFRRTINRGQVTPLPRAFVDRMYRDLDGTTRRAILAFYRSVDDPAAGAEEVAAALRPLDRPALVIWGCRDPYLPATLVAAQRTAFPRAETLMLDDAGHWPFIDAPDVVGDAVTGFLRRQLAGANG
jgi:pimeloyl-ACP methyl ester carboxylesterase